MRFRVFWGGCFRGFGFLGVGFLGLAFWSLGCLGLCGSGFFWFRVLGFELRVQFSLEGRQGYNQGRLGDPK